MNKKIITLAFSVLMLFQAKSQDFWFGNDLSYVNQMEDCGAVYKENMVEKDVYQIFADHGTNLVRVRLWNDPSWWQGSLVQPSGVKSFYSDIEDVKETIRRAKGAGMKVMLDIHYSDFWADPARQLIPRAWASIAENTDALADTTYNFTKQLLINLNNEGLMPDIVKVGNENNGGIMSQMPGDNNSYEPKSTISGSWSRHAKLYNAAFKAIREVGATASVNPKIALHFTNELAKQLGNYRNVINNGITDFDIMGISYYYSWHEGSISELESTLKSLKTNYPKYDPMVVETGYLWSTKNYDSNGNIITTPDPDYLPVSTEKQLEYMVDYTHAVMRAGGIGVIFWEPAWVSTPCRTPWGQGSSHDHVAFFDPENTNFMENGGGRWTEPQFYNSASDRKVSFKVNMKSADTGNGVYIMGDFTDKPIAMFYEGSGIFSHFEYLPQNSSGTFYFINGSTRETVPSECVADNGTDRKYTIGTEDVSYLVGFNECGLGTPESVTVTFKVDMSGKDVSRGVYIVGTINDWAISKMNEEGDSIYSYSLELTPGETLNYYYLTTSTWTNYESYRETVPSECALAYGSDRQFIVPSSDSVISVIWGTCSSISLNANQNTRQKRINIKPNPADEQVFIESHRPLANSVLTIANTNGQVVKKLVFDEKTTNNSTVGINDFEAGIYLFNFKFDNETDTVRVIVK